MTDHKGAAAAAPTPARFGADALLRDANGGEPWAKIVSADTGIKIAGRMAEDHGDGTATILLGGFYPVRGEIIAKGVVQQFGPR